MLDYIKAEIRRGNLKRGERLPPERELAEQLGVSRNSVREAVRTLSLMGFVSSVQGAGNYISCDLEGNLSTSFEMMLLLGETNYLQVSQLRRGLESETARLAATRVLPGQLERLNSLAQRMAAEPDPEKGALLDQQFHMLLCEASGNLLLRALFRAMLATVNRFIGTMYVRAERPLDAMFQEVVADELNVKNVEFKEDLSDFTSYTFKPQLKTVGPKYGKLLNGIRAHLAEINGREAMKELDNSGSLSFDIDGQKVVLSKEDLLIDTAQMEGYVTEEDSTVTVVLDTNLSEELIEEGFVREIISKIQTMRKEAGFEVMDKIVVYSMGNQKIEGYMKEYREEILSDVMASDIRFDEVKGYTKEWSINGESVTLGVEKQ